MNKFLKILGTIAVIPPGLILGLFFGVLFLLFIPIYMLYICIDSVWHDYSYDEFKKSTERFQQGL